MYLICFLYKFSVKKKKIKNKFLVKFKLEANFKIFVKKCLNSNCFHKFLSN